MTAQPRRFDRPDSSEPRSALKAKPFAPHASPVTSDAIIKATDHLRLALMTLDAVGEVVAATYVQMAIDMLPPKNP